MTTSTTPEAGGQESTTTVCTLDGGRALLAPLPLFALGVTGGDRQSTPGGTAVYTLHFGCGCRARCWPDGEGPRFRCPTHAVRAEPCAHEWVEVREGGTKGRPWFRCRRCSAERHD